MTSNRIPVLASVLFLLASADALAWRPDGSGTPRSGLPELMNFESSTAAGLAPDWMVMPRETVAVDHEIVHGGSSALRITRDGKSPQTFTFANVSFPIDFVGKTVELRGHLRTKDVEGMAGLWLREDAPGGMVAFDNMASRKLAGSTDWSEYSISLPLKPEATHLIFGVLLVGTGTTWADDLQLLVDGEPVATAPTVEREKTVLETDHAFDGGSKVTLDALSKLQVRNLTMLGRVWGFLKYHHPAVTAGKRQWDYELFRVLPAIVHARSAAEANGAMLKWIDGLGPVEACTTCASLDENALQERPRLAWIADRTSLGAALSKRLTEIHRARPTDKQFFVSMAANVGNPEFDVELSYADAKVPDAGFQLLAVYRFWNIVEYWYPYRDVMDEDWPQVLAEAIPEVALARTELDVKRGLLKLIVRVHDTHANLWSSLDARPPGGDCRVPLDLRFVGGRAVIAKTLPELPADVDLAAGDVVVDVDGAPVTQLVERWSPYYAGSNDAARKRAIAGSLTTGACAALTLGIERDGKPRQVTTARTKFDPKSRLWHDRPGETFQRIGDDIAYLKLSTVKAADVPGYIAAAADTKGLIVDIRNYPAEFVVFALGTLLVDREVPFAVFTVPDLANPGAFRWSNGTTLPPATPHYGGKVVVLVDDASVSQAEYTAMALRASPRAIVIGGTTSGADGNVSSIALPFGLRTAISGIGVFYPDRRPTQRVGIVPDIVVSSSIAGLREGRDEVLERAIAEIRAGTPMSVPANSHD